MGIVTSTWGRHGESLMRPGVAGTEQVLKRWDTAGSRGSPPRRHPALAGWDSPSASSGAHPGGTAPPSSGTAAHSPSLAAAPGVTDARLTQSQRPELPWLTAPLKHGFSLPQAPRMQLPTCTKTHVPRSRLLQEVLCDFSLLSHPVHTM